MANIIDSNPLRALDANGDPVSGARLYIYDTGTTTLQTVYTDSALTTPASQPIVANSSGVWAPVYHSGVTNVHITAIDTGGNVLPGFPIDPAQSIPLSSSGASQVSFSPSASIAATTVQAAIEEVESDALQNIVEDTTPQLGGPLDANSQQIRQAKGADIASDGTLTLGDDGNSFDVTGTTTITAIAAKAVGTVVVLQFDGALTLTHHATDLILPGAANITTAAGDIAVFTEYASGDWRCVSYTRADGKPVVPSDKIFTEEFESSGLSITSGGSHTVAHGLSARPRLILGELICTSAIGGYSVGDVVPVSPHSQASGTGDHSYSVVPDATNLNIRFSNNSPDNFQIIRQDTGAAISVSGSNFDFRIRAWV